jgi:hypothetical protein
MIAHGANPDNTDEETFRQICVMFSDGIIGNNLVIETLGNLTAGVYNYMKSSNSKAYTLSNIIGRSYEYLYPPQNNTESVNDALLTYVTQAKGFTPNRFKVKK